MDGVVENSGRASSMNENAGTADESTRPSELGIVGEGGPVKLEGVDAGCSLALGGLGAC